MILSALDLLMRWDVGVALIIGSIGGVIVGAIPGVGPAVAIAILLPATFSLEPIVGLTTLLGIYGSSMATGTCIVSNLGAANPTAGARRTQALAREIGVPVPRVASVLGDDLRAQMSDDDIRALPRLDGAALIDRPIVAANVYLGAEPVRDAVATGADIVLVGRTTDSALALGPLMHEFGWSDLDRLAAGTIVGHLLECGGQITGAYFADPGFKDVPDLAHGSA